MSVLGGKNFNFFFGKGPPCWAKWTKFFSQPDMTTHTPIDGPCQVFVEKCCLQIFWIDICPKKLKNSVKIRRFKLRFEKPCY
jgi:hypothetical protein